MASGKPVTSNLIAPQKQLPRWDMALPLQVVRVRLANIRRDIPTLRYQINWPETSTAHGLAAAFATSRHGRHSSESLGCMKRYASVGLCECPSWVCAVERRRFPVGARPTRQPLQPEATGAVMEETKWLKPSVSVSRIGDSASVQAVTRVNAEQASKRTMRRPTRPPFRGRLIRLGEAERRVHPAAAPG